MYKRVLLKLMKGSPKRTMLLVGDERGIARARTAFERHPEEGVNIKNIVRVDKAVSHTTGAEKEVGINDAAEYIRNEWIDEVYIAIAEPALIATDKVTTLISQCHEMAVTVHQQMFMPAIASDDSVGRIGNIEDADFSATGYSYTLSLISGKYKPVILYCLMEYEPVRFNEMRRYLKNVASRLPPSAG